MSIRPTRRCLLIAAAGLPVAALPSMLSPSLWPLWVAFVGGLLAMVVIDAMFAPSAEALETRVVAPAQMAVGVATPLYIHLDAQAGAATPNLALRLDHDAALETSPLVAMRVHPGAHHEVEVSCHAPLRGKVALAHLWMRWSGPYGLAERRTKRRLDQAIAVVPDIGPVRQAAIRLFQPRNYRSGLKVERYVGDGTQFESMREYVPGLDPRALSWRATARHRRLICHEFRAERNHQLMLAIDTGRLMAESVGGPTRLDHAITAALVLGYVGLRTGDRVGLVGFDAKVRTFAEPSSGRLAFPRLQQLTGDLAYGTEETNFTLGLGETARRLRRRSLIVLLTDMVDSITAELMVENVHRLLRRHLVVVVALRDPALTHAKDRAPASMDDMYRSVVSTDLLQERSTVIRKLESIGVICVDAAPHEVGTQLLNTYLEVKRRELVG